MVETNYKGLVSRKPPEGLLNWALQDGALQTAGFVYEKIWTQDTSLGAVLEDRVRKVPVVVGTCSECGNEMEFDYIPKESMYRNYKPTYGFRVFCPDEIVGDGDEWICPACGSQVKVKKKASIGRGSYVTDAAYVISASLLKGEKGKRPLVLTQWRIQRLINQYAHERYEVEPVEAYVFEEKDVCYLRGWVTSYSGNAGYFMTIKREWSQPKRWKDEMGSIGRIFGLTKELVEESCLYNSKLDMFMDLELGRTIPVGYLRLYQKYPQVENLVVQGCGHILARIFEEMERGGKWEKNVRGMVEMPPELHLEEKRPAQMLGLDKEELRVMKKQGWDLYHWRIYVKAKAAGDRMEIPRDIEELHRYGEEDVENIIGLAPVGKCLRYLMKQIEVMAERIEDVDPFEVCEEDEGDLSLLSAKHLADYWRMAEVAGWNLDDPEVRWPKDLIAAHDRAMEVSKVVLDKEQKRLIRKWAKEWVEYAYSSGELMIFPAGSQEALNKEGEKLHHCVAGYGKDIASGETAVFFIRHTWERGKPYFTLEYKNGKVEQNRGLRNCGRTKEVEAFEREWLAWIEKGRPRDRKGRPVGAKPVVKEKPKKSENKEVNVA